MRDAENGQNQERRSGNRGESRVGRDDRHGGESRRKRDDRRGGSFPGSRKDRPGGELREGRSSGNPGGNHGGRAADQPFENRRADGEKYGERRFEKRGAPWEDRSGRRGENRPSHGEGGHQRAAGAGLDRGEGRGPRHGENLRAGTQRRHGGEGGEKRNRGLREERPKTARDVALAALGDVVRNQAYASQALDRALTEAELSPEDRRLAASLFYFAVENRLQIEWALGKLLETRPEPVVNDILHLAAAQILFMDKIPDHAAVDEAVKMVRNAGRGGLDKLVNGVLRSLIRARDAGELALPDREAQPEEYLSIRCSLAMPAVKRLAAAYGVELAEQIAGFAPEQRTITVRPNTTRIDGAAFEAMLDREGFAWKHGAAENAYILSGAGSLAGHEGYRDGLFSIQGESSMLAAQAVEARRGMQILDACAAPGGKTCLMAEAMGGSGRVHAWDVHPHRVELVRAAARRLGLENVRPAVHDARRPMESMELAMDAVLVDAPCSGLGVMSDKPDVKFRVTEEELTNLLPLQRQILENCAQMVKVGGRLVYSTCTILPEENEQQVRAFLERHGEFEMDADDSWLPERFRGRMESGMLQLLPGRDGVEGFFIARMRRRSV